MPYAPHGAAAMRIVADTNTVLSGLLWQGPPRRLLELALGLDHLEHQAPTLHLYPHRRADRKAGLCKPAARQAQMRLRGQP